MRSITGIALGSLVLSLLGLGACPYCILSNCQSHRYPFAVEVEQAATSEDSGGCPSCADKEQSSSPNQTSDSSKSTSLLCECPDETWDMPSSAPGLDTDSQPQFLTVAPAIGRMQAVATVTSVQPRQTSPPGALQQLRSTILLI